MGCPRRSVARESIDRTEGMIRSTPIRVANRASVVASSWSIERLHIAATCRPPWRLRHHECPSGPCGLQPCGTGFRSSGLGFGTVGARTSGCEADLGRRACVPLSRVWASSAARRDSSARSAGTRASARNLRCCVKTSLKETNHGFKLADHTTANFALSRIV